MEAPQDRTSPGLLTSLLRYKLMSISIVVFLTALSGVFGYLTLAPASAEATMAMKIPDTDDVVSPGIVGDASTTRYVEQRAQFATNDGVLGLVASQIGGTSISSLREQISAKPVTGTNVVVITAKAGTASAAVALANAAVAAYRTQSAEVADRLRAKAADELNASQQALRTAAGSKSDPLSQAASTTLAELQRRGADLRVSALVFGDGVDFVNSARLEDAVVPGPPYRDVAVGFVLGLGLAAVIAWLRADRDRRIIDANRPTIMLDAPLLGVVQRQESGLLVGRSDGGGDPGFVGSATALAPAQYHLVGTALMRRAIPGVVSVIGPPGKLDRAESALNVAIALAADGSRVLIIDADPAGSVSARLRALSGGELSSPEDGSATGPRRVQIREDVELFLVSPGSDKDINTGSAARDFAERIWADHEKYDMVIVDTPPIDTTPLAPALMRISTGILAIVPRGSDESAISEIGRTAKIYSTPLIGFVYTGARGIG